MHVLQDMAMKVDVSLCLLVLSILLSSHHFAKADNEIGKPLITATCSQTEFPDVASQLWSQILAAPVQILLAFPGLAWSWP